jgi:hypothetical protein
MVSFKVSVEKPVIIAVEGIDDRKLLEHLCHHWNLNDIQFISLDTKPSTDNVSAVINMPGFRQTVKAFGIIRDADNCYQPAKNSVEDILQKLGNNIRTGYFIFPDNSNSGILETLLMLQVSSADPNRARCVDAFMACLVSQSVNISDHKKDKAKVYAYLSAFDDPGKRIGEAASAGYWNHDSVAFNNLKQFLSDLSQAV